MKMFIKKKIGKTTYTFTVEGKNLYEMVTESQKLSFPDVDKCGICGKNNIILHARKAQDKFKYTEVKCLDCRAQLTFGQTQESPDTFYLRKTPEKKFAWQEYSDESEQYKKSIIKRYSK